MAWDKGFNFRESSGFVGSDGTNCTYVLDTDSYTGSVIRNGAAFGWLDSVVGNGRDRNSGIDPRLAGFHFWGNDGTQKRFRVDLPAASDYIISLALGDNDVGQVEQHWQLFDNTTLLATIADGDGVNAANWDDATGTSRTLAAWPGSNASITRTFATTTLICKIGHPTTAVGGNATIAHLFVSQVGGGGGWLRHRR